MKCDGCGASMRMDRNQGVFVCDYCGTQAIPPEGDDGVHILGVTKIACPVCATVLADGAIESHCMRYCQHCRGMLVAMDDFLADLRARRDWPAQVLAPRGSDNGRVLACPNCGRQMEEYPYGGGGNVNIDSCESCGLLWLDRGELRRIAAAPDREPQFLQNADMDSPSR
jgi:Zn-finger nucleic acid-binding protein